MASCDLSVEEPEKGSKIWAVWRNGVRCCVQVSEVQFLTFGLPEEAVICSAKTLEFVTYSLSILFAVPAPLSFSKGRNGEFLLIAQSYVSNLRRCAFRHEWRISSTAFSRGP